jgi:hypothetical protein
VKLVRGVARLYHSAPYRDRGDLRLRKIGRMSQTLYASACIISAFRYVATVNGLAHLHSACSNHRPQRRKRVCRGLAAVVTRSGTCSCACVAYWRKVWAVTREAPSITSPPSPNRAPSNFKRRIPLHVIEIQAFICLWCLSLFVPKSLRRSGLQNQIFATAI